MYKKLSLILSKKEKFQIILIFLLNSLVFMFELISLASIPLFVSLLFDSSLFNNKLIENFDYNILQNYTNRQVVSYSGMFVVFAFICKNFFLIFLSYTQGLFFKKLKIRLSKTLFNFYLNSPYLYHLQNNPAKLSRNIIQTIEDLYVFFFHCLLFFREALTIFVIFILLVLVNSNVTILSSFSLGLISFAYIKFIKPYVKKKAFQNAELQKNIIQVIYETFGSIKDIKLLTKEKNIENFFNNQIYAYQSNSFFFAIFERMPKFILEMLSISLIVFVFFVYLGDSQNHMALLPLLSLIIISFMRFIPAFNSLTSASFYMKINEPAVDIIHNELKEMNLNTNPEYYNKKKININKNKNFFSANEIDFYYPENKIPVLNNISLDIKKGERIGLIGESGTGKSTLFHIMLGLLNPSSGDVFYQNESIFKNLTTWRNEIGYISQNIYLLDSTIERNIAFNFLDEPVDREKLNKAINIANLEEKILSLPKGFKTLVGNDGHRLSGGERQRIAIARAAYKNPNIFFMDESTSALDSKTESIIMNNLNKTLKDKTFVIIAHRKTTIDKCDKIWKLKNGKLTS